MKKIILTLFLGASLISYGVENAPTENINSLDQVTSTDEERIEEPGVEFQQGAVQQSSKGDSFMVAFGMKDPSILAGGEAGVTGGAGAGATTSATVGATTGTVIANQGVTGPFTPYTY